MGRTKRLYPLGKYRLRTPKNPDKNKAYPVDIEYTWNRKVIRRTTNIFVKIADWNQNLHAGRGGLAGLAVAVDEHTDEHGDDGRADDVERQQGLDALGEQRDNEREREARRVAFDLSGNGAHGDLTFLCR